MAKYSLSGVIQVFGSTKIPNWFAKYVFTPFLKPNSLFAAELKVLALMFVEDFYV